MLMMLKALEIGFNHFGHQFFKARFRHPAELVTSLVGIAKQQVYFSRSKKPRGRDVILHI